MKTNWVYQISLVLTNFTYLHKCSKNSNWLYALFWICFAGTFYKESQIELYRSLDARKASSRTCHQSLLVITTGLGEFLSSWGPQNILGLFVPARGSDILYSSLSGHWGPISKVSGQYFQVAVFQKVNLYSSKAVLSYLSLYVSLKYDIPVKALVR